MVSTFTPERVRSFDERAFERGISSRALMERAAGELARSILRTAGRAYGVRVGILCGKGNNGGDGLAAARRLRAAGASAVVHLVGGEESLSEDGATQLRRWRSEGGRVSASLQSALAGADVVVDCLLGTGAKGEPRPPYDEAVEALNAHPSPTVACDLPTGVDADTGAVPGVAVRAEVTLTLGAHKRGLWLWPARGHCGRLERGELGILDPTDEPDAVVLETGDIPTLVPPPAPERHKRSAGVVVVLAGSPGMSGAATLVARGAMAGGAGLVTVATSALARHLVAPTVPEALTVELPDDDPDAAFERLGSQLEGADALALGPGLGHAEPTVRLVRRLVREVDVAVVLDADGLNAFRHEGDALADHAASLLTLTPHRRELTRLLDAGDRERQVWDERIEVVPASARAWDATIVAKGPGSLVAAADGRCWVNPTGGPALATGGTGDVLTGLSAALVAQRPEPDTVAAAVWIHGRAGQLAARRQSARSVTALDVAGGVAEVFRELGG